MHVKTSSIVLLSAIVLALSCPVLAEKITSIPLTDAIVVDSQGTDKAWQILDWVEYTYPEDFYNGDAEDGTGCGLKVKVCHDSANLYLWAQVQDDSVVNSAWPNWTTGDALILGWSTEGKHVVIDGTDYQIVIKPKSTDNMRVIKLSTGLQTVSGICQVTVTTTGWTAVCSIPLSVIGVPAVDSAIGFALVLWDIDTDTLGPNIVANNTFGPMIVEGPIALGETIFPGTKAVRSICAQELKQMPDDMPLRVDMPSGEEWTITKKTDGFFYCQNPVDRLKAIRVVWPSEAIVEGGAIYQLHGKLVRQGAERVFLADDIGTLTDPQFPYPAPFYLTSSSLGGIPLGIGPSNLALRVRLTGKVQAVNLDSFVLSDGGREIKVVAVPNYPIGTQLTVTGVSSSEGNVPVLLATEIVEVL